MPNQGEQTPAAAGTVSQENHELDSPTAKSASPPPPPPPPPLSKPEDTQSGWGWGGWSMPSIPQVDFATVQSNLAAFAQEAQQKTQAFAQEAQQKTQAFAEHAMSQIDPNVIATQIANTPINESETGERSTATEVEDPNVPPSIDITKIVASGSNLLQSGISMIRENVEIDGIREKALGAYSRTIEVVKEQIDKTKEEAELLIKEFNEAKYMDELPITKNSAFNKESKWTSPWCEEYLIERYQKLLGITNFDIDDLKHVTRHRILQLSALSSQNDILAKIDDENKDEFNIWTVTTAAEILKIDSELDTLRYSLVPSKISEEVFWSGYFTLLNDLLDRLETDIVADGITAEEVAIAREAKTEPTNNTPLNEALTKICDKNEKERSASAESIDHIDDNEIDDLLADCNSDDFDVDSIDDEELNRIMDE